MALDEVYLPKMEDGLGFRSLFEVSRSFLPCYEGVLEPRKPCGLTSYGINTARGIYHKWLIGIEAIKLGSIY